MTKTLLIVIGILAALITAAGIMQYKRPWHAKRIPERSYQNHDVSGLIKQLCAEDLEQRLRAQQKLIGIGAAARPALLKITRHPDPAVLHRVRYIIKVIDLAERLKLSPELRGRFPDLFPDVYYTMNNAQRPELDAECKSRLLLRIAAQDKNGRYFYQGVATGQDIASLVADIISDPVVRNDERYYYLQYILHICAGRDLVIYPDNVTIGWPKPISETFPLLIELLSDKNGRTRGLAAAALVDAGLKEKVPATVIPDIVRLADGNWYGEGDWAEDALKTLDVPAEEIQKAKEQK